MVASTPDLMLRYERMGFKTAQLSFPHPRKNDLNMQVMVLNKETGKTGKGMNPVLWWDVWGYVSLHLYQRRIIEYSLVQKIRVYFNRTLSKSRPEFKGVGGWLYAKIVVRLCSVFQSSPGSKKYHFRDT